MTKLLYKIKLRDHVKYFSIFNLRLNILIFQLLFLYQYFNYYLYLYFIADEVVSYVNSSIHTNYETI